MTRGGEDFPPLPLPSASRRSSRSSRDAGTGDRWYEGDVRPSFIKPRIGRRKVAVVIITGKAGSDMSYSDILRTARQNISLEALGIRETRIRPAFNGGYKIEVPGEGGAELAAKLKDQLEIILRDIAKVDNPVARGELKITGLTPSTTMEEIREQLVRISGFPRLHLTSLKSRKCATEWALHRCNALLMQRYRLLRLVASPLAGRRLGCGDRDHKAKDCSSAPHCVICVDLGKNGNHRIGSYACLVNNGYDTVKRADQRQSARLSNYGN
ncbi:uncharacterized protein LOC114941853 [Nylanderia fulva]|uniref:uncharacterized protein LOC114941853 n=1 Tax=Nylanderia fulva TaxID=613905 RepID=UPI0010FAE87E|nr:uncharacterized protein LOC114941853 [Nylanderia fulva]